MQNLSSIVYSLHTQLCPTIPTLKKSHLYELTAAYSGFKSYAAYKHSVTPATLQNAVTTAANRLCFDRATSLGFSSPDAVIICTAVELHFKPSVQTALQFEKLYQQYAVNDEVSDADLPKGFLGSVSQLVELDLPEAYLFAVVICYEFISDYYEDSDNRQGKYWFEKRAAGQVLNVLQTEVADDYFEVIEYFDLLELLSEKSSAFVMPPPLSAKKVMQQFGHTSNERWTHAFNNEPDLVLRAFQEFEYEERISVSEESRVVLQHWFSADILLRPCRFGLHEKIENSSTIGEKWFWHLFGLKNSIDVTRDDLRAINADTGADYDDYGPVAVDGFQGIAMPEISQDIRNEIEVFVDSITK
jgi:hypothetical protein